MSVESFDKLIIQWNNMFPLDRWYRKKYNIPFNSIQHQTVSQIDILFEWREEKLFEKHQEKLKQQEIKEKLYKEGKWLTNQIDIEFEEIPEDMFDKIDVTQINRDNT